jgi:hypothetical protein
MIRGLKPDVLLHPLAVGADLRQLSDFPDDEGTEDRKTFVCSGGYLELAGLESLSVPGRCVF